MKYDRLEASGRQFLKQIYSVQRCGTSLPCETILVAAEMKEYFINYFYMHPSETAGLHRILNRLERLEKTSMDDCISVADSFITTGARLAIKNSSNLIFSFLSISLIRFIIFIAFVAVCMLFAL